MFDAEILLSQGSTNQVISIWLVFIYIILVTLFMLLERTKLCLITTYLFTFNLGFLMYWGEIIETAPHLAPFILYVFWGMSIAVLFALDSFSTHSSKEKLA